ncbi:hypothetical protein ACLOJK_041582 [Asimina triloba]
MEFYQVTGIDSRRLIHSSSNISKSSASIYGCLFKPLEFPPNLTELDLWSSELEEDQKVEDTAMPKLKRLGMESCKRLKMLPDGFQHITTIQELKFSGTSKEFTKRIQMNGPDWFKIRHVPALNLASPFNGFLQYHPLLSYMAANLPPSFGEFCS